MLGHPLKREEVIKQIFGGADGFNPTGLPV
jgi:hypothetical protein